MPTPSPEDFWKLVAASRLLAADVLAGLRRDYEAEAATQPAPATAEAATTAVAKWLVKRGSLTKWQGRRLLAGDSGPFFIGDYRLLDRLEAEGAGRLFRARHEPTGRTVGLLVLDPRLCQRVDVWTEIVRPNFRDPNGATDPARSCIHIRGSANATKILGGSMQNAKKGIMMSCQNTTTKVLPNGAIIGGVQFEGLTQV